MYPKLNAYLGCVLAYACILVYFYFVQFRFRTCKHSCHIMLYLMRMLLRSPVVIHVMSCEHLDMHACHVSCNLSLHRVYSDSLYLPCRQNIIFYILIFVMFVQSVLYSDIYIYILLCT